MIKIKKLNVIVADKRYFLMLQCVNYCNLKIYKKKEGNVNYPLHN